MAKKQQFQIKLCYVCGHEGYKELLVRCANCTQQAIHKYCLGVVPGSDGDTGDTYWLCYDCSPATVSDDISTSNLEQYNNQIIVIEEQPKPLCSIFPKGHHKSANEEEPTEIVSGAILIVSSSGETMIYDETDISNLINIASTNDEEIMSDNKVEGGRTLSAKPKIAKMRSELGAFGWRRSPRFKRHASKRLAVC
ncbi:hypothetical protein RND81_09G209700 [Saponaria officinalis]|uniref:Zinc finger PHD-type domain-containing protein n=1 Tax=Saponaria officinalis TaxID=3572 RepID=A0AAW1INM4_SAPOF